jgi:phosphatidylserine/phosphatidylglycerophosphate/cardiolipin synthase-like enzyme
MSAAALKRALPLALVLIVLVVVVVFIVRWAAGGRYAGAPSASPPTTSGAWYELAFTSPLYPDDRNRHRGGIEDRLVALMDRAQSTLDVAAYDFNLQPVAEAMARSAKRGVRVRMVTDSDTINDDNRFAQQALRTVQSAGITVVPDNRRPIMHNKFTIVDGEWVQTGSWNYSDSDTYRNNNNQIIIQSRELAANYTAVFEKMFTSKAFGGAKQPGVPHPSLSIGGARVENYFSPEDRPASHIIRWVRTAQQQIHFMAFSFTHDGIGDAMLERSKAGVQVRGVFEVQDSTTRFSEYGRLKEQGLDVLQDGNPFRLHHKVILIDGRVSVLGSFNFSSNADRDNDENLLIVEDSSLASALEAEFQRVRNQALNPPAPSR